MVFSILLTFSVAIISVVLGEFVAGAYLLVITAYAVMLYLQSNYINNLKREIEFLTRVNEIEESYKIGGDI